MKDKYYYKDETSSNTRDYTKVLHRQMALPQNMPMESRAGTQMIRVIEQMVLLQSGLIALGPGMQTINITLKKTLTG